MTEKTILYFNGAQKSGREQLAHMEGVLFSDLMGLAGAFSWGHRLRGSLVYVTCTWLWMATGHSLQSPICVSLVIIDQHQSEQQMEFKFHYSTNTKSA